MARKRNPIPLAIVLAVCAAGVSAPVAQTSANYRLTESTLNGGGDPLQGAFPSSSHYRVRLDALGDSVVTPATLSSASFRMDGGFMRAYPPPGEVLGLRIAADKRTLTWSPERSVGSYDIYRDLVSTLPGNFGSCLQARIASETWPDSATPPTRGGFFYLVTARNRLDEEGTKGNRSSGAERPNPAPCP